MRKTTFLPPLRSNSALAAKAAKQGNGDLAALLLNATAATKNIVHVPHILVHVRSKSEPTPNRIRAVARHVAAKGAKCVSGQHGTVKVEWPLPEKLPLVTIIVPTKDKLDVLRPCAASKVSSLETVLLTSRCSSSTIEASRGINRKVLVGSN